MKKVNKESIKASALKAIDTELNEVEQLKNRIDTDFVLAVELILATEGKVIVSGIGKSGHIGHKIAATLASTGTPAFFVHPAEALHGDLGMISSNDTFIAISQSGETEEVLKILPFIRKTNNQLIALTGNKDSTLARFANVVLSSQVTKEACPLQLAPTSSTTVALVLGDALAIALMEARGFSKEGFAKYHPGGSLGRKLLTTVREIMRTDRLPTISVNTSFQELILTMSTGQLGMAIVQSEEGELMGVITDGDLRRAWATPKAPDEESVQELMNSTPKTIEPDINLYQAEKIFNELKVTTLLVQENKQVIGAVQVYQI